MALPEDLSKGSLPVRVSRTAGHETAGDKRRTGAVLPPSTATRLTTPSRRDRLPEFQDPLDDAHARATRLTARRQ
jgi:hypothetical protein